VRGYLKVVHLVVADEEEDMVVEALEEEGEDIKRAAFTQYDTIIKGIGRHFRIREHSDGILLQLSIR